MKRDWIREFVDNRYDLMKDRDIPESVSKIYEAEGALPGWAQDSIERSLQTLESNEYQDADKFLFMMENMASWAPTRQEWEEFRPLASKVVREYVDVVEGKVPHKDDSDDKMVKTLMEAPEKPEDKEEDELGLPKEDDEIEAPTGEQEPLGDEPEEEEQAEIDFEKVYLGHTEDTHYYIVADKSDEGEMQDLQLVNQEGDLVFSAKEHELDVLDVTAFIDAVIQEVDVAQLERSVVLQYIIPDEEEELPDEEDIEPDEFDEPIGDEEELEEPEEEPAATPKKPNESKGKSMKKKLAEKLIKDDKGNTFNVQLIDETEQRVILQINDKEYRFGREFAHLFGANEGRMTDEGVDELARETISHLNEEDYVELMAQHKVDKLTGVQKESKTNEIFGTEDTSPAKPEEGDQYFATQLANHLMKMKSAGMLEPEEEDLLAKAKAAAGLEEAGMDEDVKEGVDGEYGVRFRFARPDGRVVLGQKFFDTEEARTKWADNYEKKDHFVEFVSWSDPKNESEDVKEDVAGFPSDYASTMYDEVYRAAKRVGGISNIHSEEAVEAGVKASGGQLDKEDVKGIIKRRMQRDAADVEQAVRGYIKQQQRKAKEGKVPHKDDSDDKMIKTLSEDDYGIEKYVFEVEFLVDGASKTMRVMAEGPGEAASEIARRKGVEKVTNVKKIGESKVKEGKTKRGKRDGTGPFKGSARRSVSKIGRRKAAGKKCVKEDQLPGGLGDNKTFADFDEDQIAMGVEVEMEHTNDATMAKEIALDHLTEDPEYYTKLARMEAGACDETNESKKESNMKKNERKVNEEMDVAAWEKAESASRKEIGKYKEAIFMVANTLFEAGLKEEDVLEYLLGELKSEVEQTGADYGQDEEEYYNKIDQEEADEKCMESKTSRRKIKETVEEVDESTLIAESILGVHRIKPEQAEIKAGDSVQVVLARNFYPVIEEGTVLRVDKVHGVLVESKEIPNGHKQWFSNDMHRFVVLT